MIMEWCLVLGSSETTKICKGCMKWNTLMLNKSKLQNLNGKQKEIQISVTTKLTIVQGEYWKIWLKVKAPTEEYLNLTIMTVSLNHSRTSNRMATAVVCKKVLQWVWSQGNVTLSWQGSCISCYHGDMHIHCTVIFVGVETVCVLFQGWPSLNRCRFLWF